MKEDQNRPSLYLTSCPLCSKQKHHGTKASHATTEYQLHLYQHIAHHLRSLAVSSVLALHSSHEPSPGNDNVTVSGKATPYQFTPLNANNSIPSSFYSKPFLAQNHGPPRVTIESPISRMLPIQPPPPPPPTQSTIHPTPHPNTHQHIHNNPISSYRLPAIPQPKETLDILIIEDNIVNQRLISKMLQRHRHRVVQAFNGLQGLNAVKKRKYDLIFMDMCMPVMVRSPSPFSH